MIYGFIGVGNLASAVIGGMRSSDRFRDAELRLYDRNPEKSLRFAGSHTLICGNESEVVKSSEVIFIAIKPVDFETTLAAVNGCCDLSGKVFVSTAAAVTTEFISSRLSGAKVVRTMPNTPISVGIGATAICAGSGVSKEELALVGDVFSSGGVCVELDESLMNKVISVNGSSPAYVFAFIKAIADWAIKAGIDSRDAFMLAAQSVKGSAEMLARSDKTAETLIKNVCSPGGTTIEAMKVLESGDFEGLIGRAMDACAEKADMMAKK